MSIAQVVAQLRGVLTETEAAVQVAKQARVSLASSSAYLSAATIGSSHYQALAAIAQLQAAYATCEVALQDLFAARAYLEQYLDHITGGGTGSSADVAPVVTAPVMDPAFDNGPLGADFTPGVFRREEFEHEHERRTADHLADQRGWNVYARREIQDDDVKNPDAMIRKDRSDPGTVTEFKRPTALSYNAVRKNLRKAAQQLEGWQGGDAVVDGRAVGLTESQARTWGREAVEEAKRKSEPRPARVHFILRDGSMITISGA